MRGTKILQTMWHSQKNKKIKRPRKLFIMKYKLEEKAIESIQNQVEREKRLKKIKIKLSIVSCGSKASGLVYMCEIRVPEKEKVKGIIKIVEEIRNKCFL